MAVKPLRILIILLILIVLGAAISQAVRINISNRQKSDENKFIAAYVALSVARAWYGNQPDSFAVWENEIASRYQADSTWMRTFAASIAKNENRSQRVWQKISAKLDSLRTNPNPLEAIKKQPAQASSSP